MEKSPNQTDKEANMTEYVTNCELCGWHGKSEDIESCAHGLSDHMDKEHADHVLKLRNKAITNYCINRVRASI